MDKVYKIAVYGKGGIGKSVVATSLSACFGQREMKVLHVGCDPKHDSAVRLTKDGKQIRTVLDVLGQEPTANSTEHIINEGRLGIDCCEAGGPAPGLGCGGRGVARMLEFLDDMEVIETGDYKAVVFDVLGDVVCGGFAAPLRQGFAEMVIIVMSEEPMALYAANNITHAVHAYHRNGVVLGGLVANIKSPDADKAKLEEFAAKLNTRILAYIPRDPLIMEAERKRKTVVEYAPEADSAKAFHALAEKLMSLDPKNIELPTPMDHDEFYAFMETW